MSIRIDGTNTAANPGITGADADTGLQFGTDEVNVVTGGSTRVTVDSSGNVGVGSTTPGRTLDVNGVIRSDGTSGALAFGGNSSTPSEGVAIHRPAADTLAFVNGSTERARLDSSGRLLVGIDSAIATGTGNLLQVSHSNAARITLGNSSTTISSSTNLGLLSFRGFDASTWNEGARIAAVSGAGHTASSVPTDLRFYTTPSGGTSVRERARIDYRGQVLMQESGSASSPFHFATTSGASGSVLATFRRSATAGTVGTGTEVCRIARDGDLTNTNNSYGSLSDQKLKENIVDANSQWDDIKALQVRNYNFKAETGNPTHTQIGVIAQEVELVSPGLVTEIPDIDEAENDLGTTTRKVNYSVLYMKAVKALQEAMTRIEQLETRVAQLEGGAS